jgi:hypothetical protein
MEVPVCLLDKQRYYSLFPTKKATKSNLSLQGQADLRGRFFIFDEFLKNQTVNSKLQPWLQKSTRNRLKATSQVFCTYISLTLFCESAKKNQIRP